MRTAIGASAAAFTLLAGCASPAAPSRPSTRPARVGFLSIASRQPYQGGLGQGLRDHGYVEGQSVTIERRSAEGQADRLPQLAAELVALKVDVIVAAGTAAAVAARDATTTIPIVFVTSGDPVASRLVASRARPGGNITGISSLIPELAGKRLEFLQQLAPDTSRILLLVDSSEPGVAAGQLDELKTGADAAGAQLQVLDVHGMGDIERTFENLPPGGGSGLLPLLDPLASGDPRQLVGLVATRALPAIYSAREFVDVGGLMSYGPNMREQLMHAAVYVDKLLRSSKASDLPVERPPRFELVINRNTAEALGITMTEAALLLVDEVI